MGDIDSPSYLQGVTSTGVAVTVLVDPSGIVYVRDFATLNRYRNINLLNVGQLVATGAHRIFDLIIQNQSTLVRYIKVYDKATAPIVGTDTPIHTFVIPAGVTIPIESKYGIPITLGFGIAATTGIADNNNGAPLNNDIVVNALYD